LRKTNLGDKNWHQAATVFVPIFLGPEDCGHWTALVIDRRHHQDGIFSFADSLGSSSNTVRQTIEQKTPLFLPGSIWKTVEMLSQAPQSNDCGAFMMLFFASYLKMILGDATVPSNFNKISLEFTNSSNVNNTLAFGRDARQFVCDSIREGSIDLKKSPAKDIDIQISLE
jgi:hypothetical protein